MQMNSLRIINFGTYGRVWKGVGEFCKFRRYNWLTTGLKKECTAKSSSFFRKLLLDLLIRVIAEVGQLVQRFLLLPHVPVETFC